ncbi:MAG: type II secretion system protein [Coraliomargarita sp.]
MMKACRHNKISRSRAFTLLELIGVLAIISILLAAAAPLTVQLIQTQRQASDDAYLPVIADALKRGVLREQLFPLDDAALPGPADTSAWWRLAARHGGGSEGQIRFPEGSDRPRRLFLAAPDWAGKTFYETTGDGSAWLADVNDPAELRMLLLSTTNPDLLLPASLTPAQFEAFWSDWSIGANGNPAIGSLADFGLNVAAWTGRAAELNLERIDLRDLLCRVVIENRRILEALYDNDGNLFSALNASLGTYLAQPLPELGSYNLDGVRASLKLGAVSSNGVVDEVAVDGLYLVQPGRPVDETAPAGFIIAGQQLDADDNPQSVRVPYEIYTTSNSDAVRAPMALINPLSNAVELLLDGWGIGDDPIQDRFFLKSQELRLKMPWSGKNEGVGIFIINENYSTLRFDGLAWSY